MVPDMRGKRPRHDFQSQNGRGPTGPPRYHSRNGWEREQELTLTAGQTQQLTLQLAHLSLRLEDELARMRSESAIVLHTQTSQGTVVPQLLEASKKWQDTKSNNPDQLTMPLRTSLVLGMLGEMQHRLTKLVQTEEARQKALKLEWCQEQPENLLWNYTWWDEKSSCLKPLAKPGLTQQQVLQTLAGLVQLIQAQPECILRFHATRKFDKAPQRKVVTFMLTVGYRGAACDSIYTEMEKLCGLAAMMVGGIRVKKERQQRQPAAQRVEKFIR